MITIAAVIIGALVAAIFANNLLQPHLDRWHEKHGVDPGKAESWASGVLGPSVTLLALFLAFVIADVASTYSDAKKATRTEAAVIDDFAHTAAYLKDPYRRKLEGAALCYARAVAGPDWAAMRDGSGGSSTVPGVWTGLGPDGLRTTFHELGLSNALFFTLTEADQARADSRRTRLTVASPAVPKLLIAFMLAVIAAVLIYHAVTSPPRSFLHGFGTFVSVATLLGAMGLIYAFQRPFSGALEIKPTAFQATARTLTAGFVARYGEASVLCDANGNPVKAPAQ